MKNSMDTRLSKLESAHQVIEKISEDDPRVVAMLEKSRYRYAEIDEEIKSGIKIHERLPLAERVKYLRERVQEVEYIISHNGGTPDDEINKLRMGEVTFRIYRDLIYDIACDEIDELRENFGDAEREQKRVQDEITEPQHSGPGSTLRFGRRRNRSTTTS